MNLLCPSQELNSLKNSPFIHYPSSGIMLENWCFMKTEQLLNSHYARNYSKNSWTRCYHWVGSLPLSSSILIHFSYIGDPDPPYCRACGRTPQCPPPKQSVQRAKNAHMYSHPNGFLAPGNIPKEKLACKINPFSDTVTVLKNTVEGLFEPLSTQPKPIPPQVNSEHYLLL